MEKANIDYKIKKINFYGYILALVFSLILISWASFFFYQNFFNDAGSIDSVLSLKNETSFEVIDMKRFEKVIVNSEKKEPPPLKNNSRNPFIAPVYK